MQVNNEYLQSLGLGLQALRASGQFCDAMVCVGSTRILVHKNVLSAASKTLHDLALEFDMTPHRERDQLEIIIPPDVSLFAVNMFINFLYTGQLELNSRVVSHIERLATLFGVTLLQIQCQEYIQKNAPPDSQNLNLRPENQIEPDSSINGAHPAGREERLLSTPDDNSQGSNLSRSNSVCSVISGDLSSNVVGVIVKTEPLHLSSYEEAAQSRHSSSGANAGNGSSFGKVRQSGDLQTGNQTGQNESSMSMLEKLMSPIVNLKKLPSNITPETVVMVSDDEMEEVENDLKTSNRKPSLYSLEEKEAIAVEAKRYGTTQVANTRNIPIPDILSWMTLFGLRNPGNQRLGKHGKQVNHDADLAIVRWIVQQQEINGSVDLNSMKQYALTIHQQSNPKFCASKTWLGNFLQRNMSVLQGTKFVHGDKGDELDIYGTSEMTGITVKQEVMDGEDKESENILGNLGEHTVLEDIPLNEQLLVSQAVEAGLNADDNDDDNFEDDSFVDDNIVNGYSANLGNKSIETSGPNLEMIQTPFGKRPIIIGQSKAFDAKSERKIVQWVLERHARDGYVFTDDFKNYARTLYKGSKVFGATQAWMKKFLRRNRALKNVKFCSKFKNVYSTEDKVNCVAMAKRYGVSYAAKHTGINQKVIHCWKLAYDKGMLNVDQSALMKIDTLCSSLHTPTVSQSIETPSSSGVNLPANFSPSVVEQATRGIVPEFEQKIVQEIKDLQLREGSVNYSDISKISQSIYKETRPNFKASYNWVKSFLDRHKTALVDIELENVSKLLIENEPAAVHDDNSQLNNPKITEMVDQALLALGGEEHVKENSPGVEHSTKAKRPIVVGPSVMFDRKTERKLVDWALEKQEADGYVFTDDFKHFAKSVHTGPKNFTASSGWMTLFLRRHHILKDVQWRSKYKNNYTEEEKIEAVSQAKRLGTGHVGRMLNIEPKLISAWRFKMEKNAPKQTFWKGTKILKFGKGIKSLGLRYAPGKHTALSLSGSDAARGIVPEFEQKIVDLILEEHGKEGSISYEEMSRLAQSVYKETRPTFKASYAWIRNFMKRNEENLQDLNIDNVKKVFLPDEGNEMESSYSDVHGTSVNEAGDFKLQKMFHRRPIIVGQSRSLDTKTEKKLVQWTVEQQEKNGYVFLDQFKSFAQSLYKGEKKFAATQAWRVKFLRRNHSALKNVKFQSSFRNQYSLDEKKTIVQEAKKYGAAHVAKTTGIEHCLINAWRLKLERMGVISADSPTSSQSPSVSSERPNFASKLQQIKHHVGPGLYSYRGVVPAFEKKIVQMIMNKMDDEGSVSYQNVSNFSRAVYKETRPHFKASYNWIKDFIKRHKKELRHAEFEHSKKLSHDMEPDTEVIIPEDHIGDVEKYLNLEKAIPGSSTTEKDTISAIEGSVGSLESRSEMDIVIDNPEDPNYDSQFQRASSGISQNSTTLENVDIGTIVAKKPIIIGKAVHFNRKTEKKIVEWLLETQNREGFVFTDDFRRYARSLYTGPPEKFGATNAWIAKFLRRNRLEGKIEFQSKLKGNNAKFEGKICELIQEQQQKEGSVSNDDIQKITQSVYKETRPNFRACYGWIKDFLKRNKEKLVGVDLENVKKVYIPDEDDEGDGVLIQNYDPSNSLPYFETSSSSVTAHTEERSNLSFSDGQSHDSSWFDLESSVDLDISNIDQSPRSVLDKLASQKRPVIIGPPRGMDSKTEKKLVQWMQEQQEKDGCVYLDLFKQYAKSIHSGPKKFAATQAWMTKFKQRNHDALKNVVIKSRFRNEYSVKEKLDIVEQAKRLGCNHVGRKLGINGGVIYSWKVQLEQMDKVGGGFSDSLDSTESSARGVVPEFENSIVRMVLETQRAKGSVTYEDVSVCARSVYKETRPNFKASNNWVMDFIRKYKEDFKDVNFENQRKFHTEQEKLHILSEEKKYGTDHVVKKRNISSSTLYHWKRNMQAKAIPIPKYKAIVSSKIKKKYAKGKNIKTYTIEEKRNMVAVAEANGVTHAALKLGISRTMLGKWIRYFRDQGENIVINFTHSSTMKKELVQKVVAWVLEENDKLGVVLTSRIIEHAKKVFEEAYTGYNATQNWLEGFLAQNSEKFEKVRFRDAGDRDMDFSDEIKLKLSRYAENHGAVETAELAGLQPKIIYHWRRNMRLKGHDLADTPAKVEIKEEDTSSTAEPKSLMQQKLDRIAAKYSTSQRKAVVSEASASGVSATASKHKLPLPLMLKWMKLYLNENDVESRSVSRSASISSNDSYRDGPSMEKLKVRLPSVEKASKSSDMSRRHSKEYKKQIVEEAKKVGVKQVCERTGLGNSTIYYWMKDERENSVDSIRGSVEKSSSSARSSLDRESSTSTSFQLRDIKKEPGLEETSNTSFNDSASSYSYDQQSVKPAVRKYTDEQKLEAAKRVHEVGHKQASLELEIPRTNVKRWYEMYKSKLTGTANQNKEVIKPESSNVFSKTTKDESPSRIGREAQKRKSFETISSLCNSKRYKYNEEDRIAFVKETEDIGTAAVAAKAGVSMDLVYKWRSKYLKAIKAETGAEETGQSNGTSNDGSKSLTNSPSMPAPRNTAFDIASKEGITVIDQGKSKSEDAQFEYLGLPVKKTVSENSEGKCCDDFETFEEQATDLIEISDDTDDGQGVHTFDDIDIIAADQILEMTSTYMEAEKEHERDPFGFEKVKKDKTDLEKSSLKELEDITDVEKTEGESDKTAGELEDKDSVTGDEKEVGAEEGSMDMIKIVDIKSEASSQ